MRRTIFRHLKHGAVIRLFLWWCLTMGVVLPAQQSRVAQNPANFPGEDACEKIAAAIAALPARGGIVDARSLTGTQTCKADPFRNAAKPVHLKLGAATISSSGTWIIPSGTTLEGLGPDQTTLVFQAARDDPSWGLRLAQVSGVEISGLLIRSTETHSVSFGVGIVQGSSSIKIHDNKFMDLGILDSFGKPRGAIYMTDVSDIWIAGNEFTRNGSDPCLGTSYEIVAGYNASRNTRVHVVKNRIHDSHTDFSIALFDTNYSEVAENNIDQNNQRFEPAGSIEEIIRSDHLVTVTTKDTSRIYKGGDWATTVNISGVGDASFDGTFVTLPLKVIDSTHFTYPQAGEDAQSAGGRYRLSANADGYGILFYTTSLAKPETACHHNLVQHNLVTNSAGQGILLQGSSDTVVSDNQLLNTDIQNDGGSHPVGAVAVNAGNPAMRFSERVTIIHNQIDTTWRSGIDIANSKQITIKNNVLQHVAVSRSENSSCIRLRFMEPNAVVEGNTCNGGVRGLYSDSGLIAPTITGNVFAGWGGKSVPAGMYFKGEVRNAAINHNSIKPPVGGGTGILVSNRTSTENTIEDNDIDLSGAPQGSGIDYRGLNAQITGNGIVDAPDDGIAIELAAQVRVERNTIQRAGRRAITKGGQSNIVRNNRER